MALTLAERREPSGQDLQRIAAITVVISVVITVVIFAGISAVISAVTPEGLRPATRVAGWIRDLGQLLDALASGYFQQE